MDTPEHASFLTACEGLEYALNRVDFPVETRNVASGRLMRDRLIGQVRDYFLPRARHLESPLTMVVGGSTGAGKSTLVNSLMRATVSASGVARPTTRRPVLVHRAEDTAWMGPDRLLPHMPRVEHGSTKSGNDDQELEVCVSDAAPGGIALIDAPDLDSVSDDNRRLSRQLLEAADVWLFVTTANRYADAVPWAVLERAAERRIAVAVVLNRVPAGGGAEILADLRRLLAEKGLHPTLTVSISEQERDERGMLPESAVEGLRSWLDALGRDAEARADIAASSLAGAVDALDADLAALQETVREQHEALEQLEHDVVAAQEAARKNIVDSMSDGALLRGEVLTRWQEFVGTGEWFRRLENGVGRVRDKLGNYLRGNPRRAERIESELESGLFRVIVEETATAVEDAHRAWYRDPAGRGLLGGDDLGHLPSDFSDRTQEEIRAWQQGIMTMMSTDGAGKRQRARFLSMGLNTAAVVLMIVVFSATGGLTGIEVGIAGGTGVVGLKLLEAIFGEDAVRRMAEQARSDLVKRIDGLLDEAMEAFRARLPETEDAVRVVAETRQRMAAAGRELRSRERHVKKGGRE
ncbi:dynamin family protein [Rothia sp. p3-SID1597]|nr:dynamin family protein [Rothia sp. p3-SID1597]